MDDQNLIIDEVIYYRSPYDVLINNLIFSKL